MSRVDTDIKNLLDISRWERLQSALADVFGITVTVLNYNGSPVTAVSNCADFCNTIRSNAVARRNCFKCSALAALESVRHKGHFIYKCSCGIMSAALPVMIDERYLGSVIIGQVRPKDTVEAVTMQNMRDEISAMYPSGKEPDFDKLFEEYYRLPEMDYEHMLRICNFIAAVIKYITERVVQSRNEAQTYEWMLRYAVPPILDANAPYEQNIQPLEILIGDPPYDYPVSPESAVYPAVNYVETHRHRMIGMHEMATLCHLSPSYFSKLFLREVGENFTNWVNRRKIEWAKEMLRDSGKSITAIASELGYMDTSYFIKVFKKFEGTTPLVYRQHKL